MTEFPAQTRDRVGIGWRPELAAGILSHLEQIDVVEVIADDYFHAPRQARRSLQTLAVQVPVVLHGVSLGLASSAPVETKGLDCMARLFDDIEPDFWSEHLSFVRAGGVEIGHLAAPPRNSETIDGAVANICRAAKVVGVGPCVENVASLIDPPGSDRSEAAWIAQILSATEAGLLLDLHNLYANALNFGFDPFEFIKQIPADRIAAIHLAGGKWIQAQGTERLLDDHLHEVPDPVYDLLELVAERAPHPLTVILERDGNFPAIECLLAELARAKIAVIAGRIQGSIGRDSDGYGRETRPRQATSREENDSHPTRRGKSTDERLRVVTRDRASNSEQFEALLANIYVDEDARKRFLADPVLTATTVGLARREAEALARIDLVGLELMARSLERKRRARITTE